MLLVTTFSEGLSILLLLGPQWTGFITWKITGLGGRERKIDEFITSNETFKQGRATHITFAHISLAEATHVALILEDGSLGESGIGEWNYVHCSFPLR